MKARFHSDILIFVFERLPTVLCVYISLQPQWSRMVQGGLSPLAALQALAGFQPVKIYRPLVPADTACVVALTAWRTVLEAEARLLSSLACLSTYLKPQVPAGVIP